MKILNVTFQVRCFLVSLSIFAVLHGTAQQMGSAMFSQDLDRIANPALVSEAFILQDQHIYVGGTVQNQWNSQLNGPAGVNVGGDYIMESDGSFKLALGGTLSRSSEGVLSSTEAAVRLSSIYSPRSPSDGGFSAGIKLGVQNLLVDTERLRQRYPDDILTAQSVSQVSPVVGVGMHYFTYIYTTPRPALVDFSLAVNTRGFGERTFSDSNTDFSLHMEPHYVANAGISFLEIDEVKYSIRTRLRYVAGAPLNASAVLSLYPTPMIGLEAGASTAGILHVGFGLSLADALLLDDSTLMLRYGYHPSFFDNGGIIGAGHQLTISYAY